MRAGPVSYREIVRVVVRQLEVQKYMLTYHIEGQVYIVPLGLISIFLYIGRVQISCGLF